MSLGKTFEDLPLEVISEILAHLPDSDLITCALGISEVWKQAAQFQKVWHHRKYYVNEEEKETEVVQIAQIIPQLSTLHISHEAGGSEAFEATYSDGILSVNCNLLMKSKMVKSLLTTCRKITTLFCPSFMLQKTEFTFLIANMQSLRALFPENTKGSLDSPLLLRPLADGAPCLEEVDFSDQLYDTEEMKYFIEKKGAQLHSLSINWCTNDDVSALPLLVNCQKSLKKLEIHVKGQGAYETVNILNTVKNLSALTDLHLLTVANIDSVEIACSLLTSSFTQLRSFVITCAFSIQDDVLLALCNSCPNLQEIKVQDSRYITERGLELISNCSNLLTLDICGCVHVEGLGTLQQCSKLTALFLSDCWRLQPAALLTVLQLSELKILCIDSCCVLGFPINNLKTYLPHLEFLGLKRCYGYNVEDIEELSVSAPELLISLNED